MKKYLNFSLSQKILIICISSLSIFLGMLYIYHIKHAESLYYQNAVTQIYNKITDFKLSVITNLDNNGSIHGLKGLNEECSSLKDSIPFAQYCALIDNNGVSLAHSIPQNVGITYDDDVTKKAINAPTQSMFVSQLPSGKKLIIFSSPLRIVAEEQVGIVQIALLPEALTANLVLYRNKTLVLGLLVVALFCFTLFYLLKINIILPFRRLMDTIVHFFHKGELEVSDQQQSIQEMSELVDFFNDMSENMKRDSFFKIGFAQEVLKRKNAEEYLELSEKKYKSIIDHIHEVIMLTRPDGTLTYISPSCKAVLGYEPAELLNKNLWIAHPQDAERVYEVLKRALGGERGEDFEYRIVTKTGEEKWITHSWQPLKKDNKLQLIVNVIREITKRKHMENDLLMANQDLMKNQELLKDMIQDIHKTQQQLKDTQDQLIQAEKMSAVGLLAGGVAHEVKNPLGVIIQGVNYLSKKLGDKSENVVEVLEMMRLSVKRADNIVKGLVDFAKSPKILLQQENINKCIEKTLNDIGATVDPQKINIIKELQSDLPDILINNTKLEQAFMNLFINAVQAMPDGGTLTVKSYLSELKKLGNSVGRRKEDRFDLGERSVIIEIEDTGEGFNETSLKRAFEPFFTTHGPRDGAGLGLAVCKNIIEMHKGHLFIDSEEGEGAKVYVHLKVEDISEEVPDS
ncbi:MAG: PAS domain S-box protein [Candidatus Omnitrophica bacterium]|nr:PAS domain S-box protein [Candidatus Omnitrophota bacterium]